MSNDDQKAAQPGYRAACDELDRILDEIESGDIDLDELSDKVERAALLLAYCRERLAATETKIRKITTGLENAAAGDDADGQEE